MASPDLALSAAPVPAVHRSARPRKRAIRQSATGLASAALGPITHETDLFALTNGQFSMIDIIEHVLDATGPAKIDLATWTAAEADLRRAHAFLLDGRVQTLRLVVDPSFRTRQPKYCETLESLFGREAIRTLPWHGKFATVRNGNWHVAIRSSMNLNQNKRIETVEISSDFELTAFLTRQVDEIFSRSPDANFVDRRRNQIDRHTDTGSRLAF